MDVISWQPYWLLKNGIKSTYPTLTKSLHCDVAVMGGGITGALVAHALVQEGLDTVLLEKDDIGAGSTSGSTCLLQYEIDKSLVELSGIIGREKAEQAYRSCYRSIDEIETIAKGLDVAFQRAQSIYVASKKGDVGDLEREVVARHHAGIPVKLLSKTELRKRFSCEGYAAILSSQAAQLDPYLLTHRLIASDLQKGLRVFDRSRVESFRATPRGVELRCRGKTVRAKHLVVASGYEANKWLPRGLVKLHSTFALTTKPLGAEIKKLRRHIFWETARPYLYSRTTEDNRIVFGGLDENFQDAHKRDALIPLKQKKLLAKFKKIFPKIPIEAAYAWAGTFGETQDGLPYIGNLAKYPRTFFACGYGGNGITFSVSAAEIIAASIKGDQHPDADLYSFDRGAAP